MIILHSIESLARVPGPVVLAIGVFDGIHLGHRAVIERAIEDARRIGGTPAVVTFDPHPARVLRPERAPRLLTSTPHKLHLLGRLGIEWVLMIPFSRDFADQPPEDFVHALTAACRPLREICVGYEWCFGKNRSGNLAMLKRMGDELGFEEVGVPEIRVDDAIVSSTRVRGFIEAGELEKASRFLGRDFTIMGTVVEGDHLGTRLGFPTANLSTHNEQFPPNGVYAVEAELEGATLLAGVVNIGVRPTVYSSGGQRLLELHLFDFHQDIYGKDIEVTFRKFIRPEMKFSGLEELKAQIAKDVEAARAILGVETR